MTTIVINENSSVGREIMNFVRAHLKGAEADVKILPDVREEQAPCRYTAAELRQRGHRAISALHKGGGTPHEEVERKKLPTQ